MTEGGGSIPPPLARLVDGRQVRRSVGELVRRGDPQRSERGLVDSSEAASFLGWDHDFRHRLFE